MSLLDLVQDAADLVGIPRPSAVVSSTDSQVRQLLALANREGKSLAQRSSWQALQTEVTWTTVAAELQGTTAAVFGSDFNQSYQPMTSYNRTQQERVGGPLSPADWQLLQADTVTGPYHDLRLFGDSVYLYPAPAAGETVAFEYISKNWCESADGTATRAAWAADDDVGRLSEDLMLLGLIWRWKQQKGFDYAEDYRTYEIEVGNALARDGGARTLSMNEGEERWPTIRAPVGSWNL